MQPLAKPLLYQLHQTVGIIAFALTAAWLFLGLGTNLPKWREGRAPWRQPASGGVRALLYMLLVATPVLGYLTAVTAPAQVPIFFLGLLRVPNLVGQHVDWFPLLTELHRILANLLVLVGAGHAVAALYNDPPRPAACPTSGQYAVAGNPWFEQAVELCELDKQQAYRVRAAGGIIFDNYEAGKAAEATANFSSSVGDLRPEVQGYFSNLRIQGAEIYLKREA